MASISSLGIGSGLDLNGLLDQLQNAERAKLEPIAEQVQAEQTTFSAYGTLKSSLSTFQDATQALNDPGSFESLTTNVEGSSVAAVTTNEAQAGRYDIQVDQLATAGSLVTERLDSVDTSIVTGEQTLSLNVADGSTADIVIADGSSLEGMRDAINEQSGGQVTASIINDGEGFRLSLMASDTGADASIASTNFSSILSADAVTSDVQVVQAGQDAAFNVNGIDIVSASNQVEGAVQGMTLNLTETGTSTVLVEQDDEALRENVTAFVEGFNEVKDTLTRLTRFDAETGQAAGLNADSTTRAVEQELRQAISSVVGGEGFRALSDIGISLQTNGKLELDDNKLNSVIATQPDALADFLAGSSEGGGMAGQINASLERLVGDGGRLGTAESNSQSRVESLEERYARTEDRIGQTVDRYRTQFQAMDSMVAQMNQTGAYLEQQLGMLGQSNQG